jgi:hypothetical protein
VQLSAHIRSASYSWQIKVRYQPTCGTYVEQALQRTACKSLDVPNPPQVSSLVKRLFHLATR